MGRALQSGTYGYGVQLSDVVIGLRFTTYVETRDGRVNVCAGLADHALLRSTPSFRVYPLKKELLMLTGSRCYASYDLFCGYWEVLVNPASHDFKSLDPLMLCLIQLHFYMTPPTELLVCSRRFSQSFRTNWTEICYSGLEKASYITSLTCERSIL